MASGKAEESTLRKIWPGNGHLIGLLVRNINMKHLHADSAKSLSAAILLTLAAVIVMSVAAGTVNAQGCAENPYDETEPNTPECNPGGCNNGAGASSSSATTSDPVNLQDGFVIETETDASISTDGMSWSHTRTYNSRLINLKARNQWMPDPQGARWEVNMLTERVQVSSGSIALIKDATHKRTFTATQDPSTYEAPDDYRAEMKFFTCSRVNSGSDTVTGSSGTEVTLSVDPGLDVVDRVLQVDMGSGYELRVIVSHSGSVVHVDRPLPTVPANANFKILDRIVLYYPDSGMKFEFAGSHDDWGAQQGMLLWKRNAYGRFLEFKYDSTIGTNGRITEVSNDNGDRITYEYRFHPGTENGKIVGITVSNADGPVNGVAYDYCDDSSSYPYYRGSRGDLAKVTRCEDVVVSKMASANGTKTSLTFEAAGVVPGQFDQMKLVMVNPYSSYNRVIRTIASTSVSGDYVTITFSDLASAVTATDSFFIVRGAIEQIQYEYMFLYQLTKVTKSTYGVTGSQVLKEFSYYSYHVDTGSNISTPWGGSQNLNNLYGADDRDEGEVTLTEGAQIGVRVPPMVKSELVHSNCGSCGGSDGTVKHTFFYLQHSDADTTDPNNVVYLTIQDLTATETVADDTKIARRIYGLNSNGVALREVTIVRVNDQEKYYCRSKILNSEGLVVEERGPSAHSRITSAEDLRKFLKPQYGSNDVDTLGAAAGTTGIVRKYYYNSDTRLIDATVVEWNGSQAGAEYVTRSTDYGDGLTTPSRLPASTYDYVVDTLYTQARGSTAVKTDFEYAFWDADEKQLKTRKRVLADVSESHNGPGTVAQFEIEYYDQQGRLRWVKDALGIVTYHSYHPVNGRRALVVNDVATSAANMPAEVASDGNGLWIAWSGDAPTEVQRSFAQNPLNRTQKFEYDRLGRMVKSTDAAGVETLTFYGANETRVYPAIGADGKPKLPIQVTKYGMLRQVTDNITLDSSNMSFGSTLTGNESYDRTHYVAWTRTNYNDGGQVASVDSFHTIPATGDPVEGTHFYRQYYYYDTQGRHYLEKGWDGTYRQTAYDALGRTRAVYQGTDLQALVKVSENFYDESVPGSGTEGVGDGNLTSTRVYYDASNYYLTRKLYDWRNRLEKSVGADNIVSAQSEQFTGGGRVSVTESFYDGDNDWQPDTGKMISRTEEYYDARGRRFRSRTYNVVGGSTFDAVNADYLETNYWYDAAGRTIKVANPNNLFTKTSYDSLGRTIDAYLCGDSSDSSYADATTVTGDTVYERTNYLYDDSQNGSGGQLMRTAHLLRRDDGGFRVSYSATWYDAETKRPVFSANYGTNGGVSLYTYDCDFDPETTGTQDYYAVLSSPLAGNSAKYILSRTEYNSAGRPYRSIDNVGRVTEATYDALGRTAQVVEDKGTDPANINRTTRYEYDSKGRLATLIAVNVIDGTTTVDQKTRYVYDCGHDASLPTAVIYPDSQSTFIQDPGTKIWSLDPLSSHDHVSFNYDYVGRRTKVTDQLQVVHNYGYDSAGRLITDSTNGLDDPSFPASVDDRVLRIEMSYDDFGRTTHVTSYNAATAGNIVDQIHYTYNNDDWGALSESRQEHIGAVDVNSSPKVGYLYETAGDGPLASASNSARYSRLKDVVYPGPATARSVRYIYNSSLPGNDRLEKIIRPMSSFQYANYTAGDLVGQVGYGTPVYFFYGYDTQTNTYVHGDIGWGGNYPAWDDFNRTVQVRWSGSGSYDSFNYGYDNAGNRFWRQVAVSGQGDKSEFYTYDRLNRLVSAERGTLVGTSPNFTGVTGKNRAHDWTLDHLGNWTEFQQDDDGLGWDLQQQRGHNEVNEVTSITGGSWVVPVYDAAGNMTQGPKTVSPQNGQTLVYDAWNRLVRVEEEIGETLVPVAEYHYDGLLRRTAKLVRHDDGQQVTWTRTDYYYNENWQVLEERRLKGLASLDAARSAVVDLPSTPDPNYWGCQYVWDSRYIDSLISREEDTNGDGDCLDSSGSRRLIYLQDANYNVTSLVTMVNGSYQVDERYLYDAYGQVTVLDGNWTPRVGNTSAYDNEILYCGYRFDPETGRYHVRHRYYDPLLGRWVTRDPCIRDTAGSYYQTVLGQPIHAVDPLGLYEEYTHKQLTADIASNPISGLRLQDADRIAAADQGADDWLHQASTQAIVSVLTSGLFGRDYQLHFPGARQPDMWYLIFGDHSASNYVYPGFLNDVVVQMVYDAVESCDADRLGTSLHVLQDSYSHEGWPERGFHPEFFDPNVGAIDNPGDPRGQWKWKDHPKAFQDQDGERRIGLHEGINDKIGFKQFMMDSVAPQWKRRVWRIEDEKNRGPTALDNPLLDNSRHQKAMDDTRMVMAEFRRHCCQQQDDGSWKTVGAQP